MHKCFHAKVKSNTYEIFRINVYLYLIKSSKRILVQNDLIVQNGNISKVDCAFGKSVECAQAGQVFKVWRPTNFCALT